MELIRHRGDTQQAEHLERWLNQVVDGFGEYVLPVDADVAQVWDKLRVPHPEHALDEQIAATALLNDLTVATRNKSDFVPTGVRMLDPFVCRVFPQCDAMNYMDEAPDSRCPQVSRHESRRDA